METGKEKRKVNIVCSDGSYLMGYVYANAGQKLMDFINNLEEDFIIVYDVEFYYEVPQTIRSFTLVRSSAPTKKESIILQKSAIKFIEEI